MAKNWQKMKKHRVQKLTDVSSIKSIMDVVGEFSQRFFEFFNRAGWVQFYCPSRTYPAISYYTIFPFLTHYVDSRLSIFLILDLPVLIYKMHSLHFDFSNFKTESNYNDVRCLTLKIIRK